jgi:hypothetical protein
MTQVDKTEGNIAVQLAVLKGRLEQFRINPNLTSEEKTEKRRLEVEFEQFRIAVAKLFFEDGGTTN